MKAPTVMFVGSVAQPWGAEIALLSLISGLGGRAEVTVVLLEEGPMVERYREVGARVIVLPFAPRALTASRRASLSTFATTGAFLACCLRLARLIRRERPDVVLGNSLRGTAISGVASRLAARPFVWMARDRLSAEYLGRTSRLVLHALLRVTSSGVIANSQSTGATLPHHKRTLVMHDPLSQEFIDAPLRDVNPHVQTIGIVGRLAGWKGHRLFLEAFARACHDKPVRARIVGGSSGSDRVTPAELQRLASELGVADQVELVGHVDAVLDEYQRLDVCVHASTIAEPFGQVVAEAMASSCLVIATDAGGPAELVRDRVNGLAFEMGSVKALAAAMAYALDMPWDERSATIAQGRQTAQALEPHATATRFLDFVTSVAGVTD